MAEILSGIATQQFGFDEFRAVQKKARSNEGLSERLARIGCLERLIAPAALLFGFIQDRDRQTVVAVAKQMQETWDRPLRLDLAGLRALQAEIAAALQSEHESGLWMVLADALAAGDYERAIDLLVQINTAVMKRRHGAAAWVAIEAGVIRIRMADEPDDLTTVEAAENRWKSTYFINSLWRVAREVSA